MLQPHKIVITGGAGFIGAHAAKHWLLAGSRVVVIDNLSRKGSQSNLDWLRSFGPIDFHQVDIAEAEGLHTVIRQHKDVDLFIHLAAQVAVTTSVLDPRTDFEINALGTFNVLEALRQENLKPFFIYSSTNKVYGGLELPIKGTKTRYRYSRHPHGISEQENLDFHSPYGCSKGAADQYVRDYARIYNIPTVVFRQSCIYGTRQFGVEDQGWIAHFIISAILERPLTVYGDGKQVRDILHVEDLINLYAMAYAKQKKVRGQVYNIGGGPAFTLSLVELLGMLRKDLKMKLPVQKAGWRPGDQKVYVSDIRKAAKEIGWKPQISPEKGISTLIEWVKSNHRLLQSMLATR